MGILLGAVTFTKDYMESYSITDSPITALLTTAYVDSPLSSPITPLFSHFRLETYLFYNSYPP